MVNSPLIGPYFLAGGDIGGVPRFPKSVSLFLVLVDSQKPGDWRFLFMASRFGSIWTFHHCLLKITLDTPTKFSIALEKLPSQKEIHLSTIRF